MIQFQAATVVLGGRPTLESVSLDVSDGRAVAIVGRTGSGKSSFLAAAATAVPLAGGDISVQGHSVRREAAAVRRLVGYVPARPGAWPPCRTGEFLHLAAAAAGLQGKPLRTAVGKALDLAGLTDRAADPMETISDGGIRRLLLARALLHDPQVLLLDDPFTGLDPHERAAVEALVGDTHLMGRTVLAAIDDAAVPNGFTDLVVLREGRAVATGPADLQSFSPGRRFRFRLTCQNRAEEAAIALRPLVADARVIDPDRVEASIDPTVDTPARVVAAAVAAGIPVEAADFHPAWTAQLID